MVSGETGVSADLRGHEGEKRVWETGVCLSTPRVTVSQGRLARDVWVGTWPCEAAAPGGPGTGHVGAGPAAWQNPEPPNPQRGAGSPGQVHLYLHLPSSPRAPHALHPSSHGVLITRSSVPVAHTGKRR